MAGFQNYLHSQASKHIDAWEIYELVVQMTNSFPMEIAPGGQININSLVDHMEEGLQKGTERYKKEVNRMYPYIQLHKLFSNEWQDIYKLILDIRIHNRVSIYFCYL